MILPRADEERARLVAAKLVDAVRDHRAAFKGEGLRVTTSIGVAVISSSGRQTAEELMVQADIAVYEAKAAGRDRYRFSVQPDDRASQVEPTAS